MPTKPPSFRLHDAPHNPQDRRAGFRGRKRVEAKDRIYKRDGAACQQCHRLILYHESRLDHRLAISKGGTHSDDNLQTLCIPCHDAKTARGE